MAKFRKLRRYLIPFAPTGDEVRRTRAKLLRTLGLARSREPRALVSHPDLYYGSVLPLAVADHVMRHGELKFLQIGAYDGSLNDEIRDVIDRYPVNGILVEPQPTVFAQLQSLHADNSNIVLVNAAIDRVAGTRPFYVSRKADLTCASFDRQHLIRHGVEPDDVVSRDVDCLTINDVLARGNLDSIDLLQIDAEGYDYEIIKTIDFNRVSPSILRFEYRHLSNEDVSECIAMLAGFGYRFIVDRLDLIALQSNRAT